MIEAKADDRKLGVDIGRGRGKWNQEKDDNKRVRLNVWVESSWYQELKELAKYEEKTVSDVVRETLGKLLVVQRPKVENEESEEHDGFRRSEKHS